MSADNFDEYAELSAIVTNLANVPDYQLANAHDLSNGECVLCDEVPHAPTCPYPRAVEWKRRHESTP